ncbi:MULTISPECIES: hypothetical protein [unclassified Variovorax]|jgi:hypothetical protein|uniref:hypothetical protein n=1 Tax=unclassified Variovorax TaxID=663243 RepID=UPI002B228D95|nr:MULTISPECIES: hypothetical protein [unclassified Variovorax]MEB0058160.1 hypothetical protein [Variovorax sp. LG9.2]MEB0112123.1 hypothetical protein [Variovorax sp. RTB1]
MNAIDSPAFPRLLRILAVVLAFDVVAFGVWSFPALRSTAWSAGSVWVFGLASVCVMWMGYWIVRSRTRLDGDVMTQTWLWNKRADAHDVVQLKLVHIRWLERAMAPRLRVRRRNGAIIWFHSADPRLLTAFIERVAQCAMQTTASAAA